jgi:hypothetical protein
VVAQFLAFLSVLFSEKIVSWIFDWAKGVIGVRKILQDVDPFEGMPQL